MVNYLLVYSGGGMPETEEEGARVMAAWGAWYEKLGGALVDGGNPIGPVKGITPDGTVSDVDGGPTGYTIVSADSMDQAVEMAAGCPILEGYKGSIQVCETFQAM
jgi:hypothetical protein